MSDIAQRPYSSLELTIDYIREFMRDHPELNRLVEGREHSDKLIAMAIFDAQDRARSMSPPVSIDGMPIYLLRVGACIFLLQSLGLLMTRNQLNYRTGRGTGIGLQDKTPLLMNWISMFQNEFTQGVKEWKIQRNLDQALGSSNLHSEYALINGLYGYWGLTT